MLLLYIAIYFSIKEIVVSIEQYFLLLLSLTQKYQNLINQTKLENAKAKYKKNIKIFLQLLEKVAYTIFMV